MADISSFPRLIAAEVGAGGATRRRMLLGFAGFASAICMAQGRSCRPIARPADAASLDDWRAFAARYISAEGRVVDTGNGGVTHSEGQGCALLFATHFDDRATFDRMLAWTEAKLRRPADALHAWRYRPSAGLPVEDSNNATNADLLIAWALLRAGEQWGRVSYTDLGTAIAADLLGTCVCKVGGATVLLPAAFGFERPDRVIINPSHYVFPAFQALSAALPHPAWDALRADGLRILRLASYGRWRLPADWLEIPNGAIEDVAPAQGWPARFSWDAARVPLNLAWAGLTAEPALGAAADFWAEPGLVRLPAWVDLGSNALASYPAGRGIAAVAEVVRAVRSGMTDPTLAHVGEADDYSSASLVLLARVVWHESRAAVAAA